MIMGIGILIWIVGLVMKNDIDVTKEKARIASRRDRKKYAKSLATKEEKQEFEMECKAYDAGKNIINDAKEMVEAKMAKEKQMTVNKIKENLRQFLYDLKKDLKEKNYLSE